MKMNPMNSKSQFSTRSRITGQVVVLGIGLLMSGLANAQNAKNFAKNPGFEQPLGPDNWTVVYTGVTGAGPNAPTNCGPGDFMVAGRSTMSHMQHKDGSVCEFGGHFAPNHNWLMHAYFKQTVSGLKPGAQYTVSAWISHYTRNDKYMPKAQLYVEALGGPDGKQSKVSEFAKSNSNNANPEGWKKYSVRSTASDKGEIELRLHFNKIGKTKWWEWRNFNAYYDDVAVVPVAENEK
jgi:hypothetical protein